MSINCLPRGHKVIDKTFDRHIAIKVLSIVQNELYRKYKNTINQTPREYSSVSLRNCNRSIMKYRHSTYNAAEGFNVRQLYKLTVTLRAFSFSVLYEFVDFTNSYIE